MPEANMANVEMLSVYQSLMQIVCVVADGVNANLQWDLKMEFWIVFCNGQVFVVSLSCP